MSFQTSNSCNEGKRGARTSGIRIADTLLTLVLTFLLCASFGLSGCSAGAEQEETAPEQGATQDTSLTTYEEPSTLQDDFFNTCNAAWMSEVSIAEDATSVSSFSEIQDEVDETLKSDLEEMSSSSSSSGNQYMDRAADYYTLASDYDARNAAGFDPLLPRLERIESYTDLNELSLDAADLMREGYSLPISFMASIDAGNSTQYLIESLPATLMLGSRSFYEEAAEIGETSRAAYEVYVLDLLRLAGYDDETAKEYWKGADTFDRSLVPFSLTDVAASDDALTYNPTATSEVASQISSFDINAILTDLCGSVPKTMLLSNVDYYSSLDEFVNEASFEQMKSWMIVNEIMASSKLLNEDARQAYERLNMALYGQEEVTAADKAAYFLTQNEFAEVIGQYYGITYLGTDARADVEAMIEEFVIVYRERLLQNDWLSPETIEKALLKLDSMAINVGWPEEVSGSYDVITVPSGGEEVSLFECTKNMERDRLEYNLSLLGTKVNRNTWEGIGSHWVNAFYHPYYNGIYITAAILNAPFYSTEQTDSQNLGGIGMVIGHEITHAFDANGSLFDESGSMSNWWTEADYAEFETRTQAMADLFEGLPYANGTVNGELTKTENVADAGGVSSALQLVQQLPEGSTREFFESYSTIWREVMYRDFADRVILSDVHAPSKLRVNIQLGNCDEFYEEYGVEQGQGMFISPEQRVKIW